MRRVALRRGLVWFFWIVCFGLCFIASSLIAELIVNLLQRFGVPWTINTTMGALSLRIVVYAIFTALFIEVSYYVAKKRLPSLDQLGIGRAPTFRDIVLALSGAVIYVIITLITQYIFVKMTGLDTGQAQNLGISTRLYGVDLLAAYVVLVIAAPLFEEFIFRGAFYGQLRAHGLGPWPVAIIVSALFGLVHGQWNVGIDVFCMSMVICYLREQTSSIWPGVIMHMMKNAVAFWFVFIAAQSVTG